MQTIKKFLDLNDGKLLLISFLSLFLELLVIRWVSVEIRIFSYFKNLALIACFLGLGLGCFFVKRPISLVYTPVLTAFLVYCVSSGSFIARQVKSVTYVLGGFEESPIWGIDSLSGLFGFKSLVFDYLKGLLMLIILFLLMTLIFLPIGNLIGRLMKGYRDPLRAYSINVLGSLIGIWAFSSLCFYSLPPVYWFMVGVVPLLLLIEGPHQHRRLLIGFGAALIAGIFLYEVNSQFRYTIWSPYQKLIVRPSIRQMGDEMIKIGYQVEVNNTFYQRILNLSDSFRQSHLKFFPPESILYDHYDIPYLFTNTMKDVLIVGAGTGNDVAGALRHGAQSIDAVEIDPMIVEVGRALHPETPYDSSKVNVVIDDARSYFKRCLKHYDMIIFGLLDSHTLTSSFTNVRLDNYVYTLQGLEEAKKHLNPDGILVLIFEVPRDWFGLRIKKILEHIFNREVLCFKNRTPDHRGTGGIVFVAGSNGRLDKLPLDNPSLWNFVQENKTRYEGEINLTTDDWPYLYLKKKAITRLYLIVVLSLIAVSTLFSGIVFRKGRKLSWYFFLLGAAFLLVEVQIISKVALIFGTTWLVNSIIISAILIMILAANYMVNKMYILNEKICYVLLLACLLINYFLPVDLFLFIKSFAFRSVVSSAILTLPLFFAAIIFATSFKREKNLELAFGSNLIGAILGGLLECVSFVTGIQALLLIAGVLYGLSFVFRGK